MKEHFEVETRLDLKVAMRDGVCLSTDLYLPKAPRRFPTVLMRTPYSNNLEIMIEKGRRLAESGYVCVIQDCRGRWDSEGEYEPYRNEGIDGYVTQEWIGRQEWSDGKIGMAGGSYLGWVQLHSAIHRSEFLTCLAPGKIFWDYFGGFVFPGGAFQLSVLATWGMRTSGRTAQSIEYEDWTEAFHTLPLVKLDEKTGRSLSFWKDWVQHPERDDYWAGLNLEEQRAEIGVPAFQMSGWFDLYTKAVLDNFNFLRHHGRTPEARQSKLVVGPWTHDLSASPKTGDVDFGEHSMVDLEGEELRWFDYWLKGVDNNIVDEAPLRLFIMGTNEWRDEWEWPLARTEWQKWYLNSDGKANSVLGDGSLAPSPPQKEGADNFTYDPMFPVQTVGGCTCCSPHIVPWGPHDQRPVEMRADVLCYSSPPLEEDMEVTGPIVVVLYAATDGSDTDWTAKLVDVSPTGYARNLCDGIVRARYRQSLTAPTLLEPNQIYQYEIDAGVTANVFRRGHRIRLEVSSSNFPRFDRNPNTGKAFGMDDELRQAQQTVFHSPARPSHLLLPTVPQR